jgi:hypothetical protein
MRTRRDLLLGGILAGFSAVAAAARPATGPFEVTYYYLPG